MRISERLVGDVGVLEFAGPIVGRKADVVINAAIRHQIDAGRRVVVASLAGVPSVDLAGLGVLVEACRSVRAAAGVLRLAGITTRIDDLVVLTRLLTVFDTFDSVEAAVAGVEPADRGSRAAPVMTLGFFERFLHRA